MDNQEFDDRKYPYQWETHLHTREVSICSITPAKEYIKRYCEMGWAGIFVTDHFFNGNCRLPRSGSWKERIHAFCTGYEAARAMGEKKGFPVLFGMEFHYTGDEYLLYGPDQAWLECHPEMMDWNRAELFRRMDSEGFLMVQAHPFRDRGYISDIWLCPQCVHAVEVYNTGNRPENDALAWKYAEQYSLPVTAGSDIHDIKRAISGAAARKMGGIAFERQLTCVEDYIKAVRDSVNPYMLLRDDDFMYVTDAAATLPVHMLDAQGCEMAKNF